MNSEAADSLLKKTDDGWAAVIKQRTQHDKPVEIAAPMLCRKTNQGTSFSHESEQS